MKKSLVYRTLQVASAVTVYAATAIWASTNHVDIVSNTITSINSLLVILAIAVVFPYLCFKALSKIYTPPASRFGNKDTLGKEIGLNEDEMMALSTDDDLEKMQYRGTRYKPDNLEIRQTNMSNENSDIKSAKPKERMKYRGSYID